MGIKKYQKLLRKTCLTLEEQISFLLEHLPNTHGKIDLAELAKSSECRCCSPRTSRLDIMAAGPQLPSCRAVKC
ncbi:unnamed protein product [Arctia plantaginis]|uniref:Uncharacterized protein n=1 Tax=Arctia plantaginis TaxID=874455 RepID=A0A8S1BA73_ARCPL|nr:unnamed protein product [Arctia plantaginis]